MYAISSFFFKSLWFITNIGFCSITYYTEYTCIYIVHTLNKLNSIQRHVCSNMSEHNNNIILYTCIYRYYTVEWFMTYRKCKIKLNIMGKNSTQTLRRTHVLYRTLTYLPVHTTQRHTYINKHIILRPNPHRFYISSRVGSGEGGGVGWKSIPPPPTHSKGRDCIAQVH